MSFGHGSFCESPFAAIPTGVVVAVPEVPAPTGDVGGGPAIVFGARFQQQAILELHKHEVDIGVAALMYVRIVGERMR